MHNNIMAAGSKDRPPMLGPGRYSQWRSRFLRYIDTKPNGEGLRKSILSGPYVPSTVLVQAVAATEGNPAIQQHTTIETVLNMTPENKEHFLSEKEAIFLLLTGIGDDIYSTVDACKTANEMWIAIERLQQGESLNVQDVKTNLFWEFGKFTSRDGESMESYYSRFYKLMNELTRNNLQVTTMQVNVQFLQQLQPEWSRFVTVVKQSKEIDTISYHTLFDILKQYQNESIFSLCYLFRNPFSSTSMGDKNPIRTFGDYSKPSHEGYKNTIDLPDPNQHLKDFLKLVDLLDLDGENRERTRLHLFQFSLRDQASNWLERLPAGSIITWEDLTNNFLAQFFPQGMTAKLRNDILMFQQHQGESLSEAWTRFRDLLQKVPHHGIDL
ncbi:hypothetical protein Tco_0635376 [Tanacetum coccineum]